MSSVEKEVFIPEQARVLTVPVHSLPSSITKKLSACPVRSDRPAAFISPVELRDKGTAQEPSPLTSGQFFLPVVTSNSRAFRMIQNFLHSGENSLECSGEISRVSSTFCRQNNSIVLFDTKIFLIVRKAKAPDWILEKTSHAPSECEAPPPDLQIKTQDDDITDRKSAGAAEDHGRCAAVLKERETDVKDREEEKGEEAKTLMKDVSTNTPRVENKLIKLEEESGDDEKSSAAKSSCCKRLFFTRVLSSSGTDANEPQGKNEVKGQIRDSASVGAAEIVENADDRENKDADNSKIHVNVRASAVEIIDLIDDDEHDTGSGDENADASQVEKMLEQCEMIQQRISDCVKSNHDVTMETKSHDVTEETGADCDDLIIVDKPNQNGSDGKHHVNGRNSKGEGCESGVQMVDLDDDGVLLRSLKTSKGQSEAESRACLRALGERAMKIMDLNDDDDDDDDDVIITDREVRNSGRRLISDGANGCKRRISDRMKDQTDPDVATKRSKCSESHGDPNSQVQHDNSDVEVIEVDDDDDDDERFVKSHVSEVQSEKSSEMEKANDGEDPASSKKKQQNFDIMNDRVSVQLYLSDEDPASEGESERCEFAGEISVTTNQSSRGEGAGVTPRPTSPQLSHEVDYDVLRREENIDRIRAKLRRMEEKFNTLKTSQH